MLCWSLGNTNKWVVTFKGDVLLGCSVPSAARVLVRAQGFLNTIYI